MGEMCPRPENVDVDKLTALTGNAQLSFSEKVDVILEDDGLANAAVESIVNSMYAENTVQSYDAATNLYVKVCTKFNRQPFPVDLPSLSKNVMV